MANIISKSLLFDKMNMLIRLEIEFPIQKHHILYQFVIRRLPFRHNSVDEYEIFVDKKWPKSQNFHNFMNFGAFSVNLDLYKCSHFLVSPNLG